MQRPFPSRKSYVRLMNHRAIMLWSGGKDCHLALHEAHSAGYEIKALVTFVPENAVFKAHPLDWMRWQAHCLGLKFRQVTIAEPYADSYEEAFRALKQEFDLSSVVTGDISEVHGNSNWITDRTQAAGLETFLPLWHRNRKELMQCVLDLEFEVVLSCVKEPWMGSGYLGSRLTTDFVRELERLGERNGLDLCGENGEYHTMVLDGPGYSKQIRLTFYQTQEEKGLWYMGNPQFEFSETRNLQRIERSKTCEKCGTGFSCFTEQCWCAELPMIMPMGEALSGDCLCPTCLKACINERLVEAGL